MLTGMLNNAQIGTPYAGLKRFNTMTQFAQQQVQAFNTTNNDVDINMLNQIAEDDDDNFDDAQGGSGNKQQRGNDNYEVRSEIAK